MEEIWKPIVGFEDHYEVSSHGNVRRAKSAKSTYVGRLLKPHDNGDGYFDVLLSADSRTKRIKIHKLVAMHFLGERPPGHQINHIDKDKTNNTHQNLEYVTARQNMLHSYSLGDRKSKCPRGENHANHKLSDKAVAEIKQLIANGQSMASIARFFGVSFTAIWRIKEGRAWSHIQPTQST